MIKCDGMGPKNPLTKITKKLLLMGFDLAIKYVCLGSSANESRQPKSTVKMIRLAFYCILFFIGIIYT